ncbi:MAG TPA: hypothetical protein VN711_03000, partial [Candidatus Saccharimonadales bacterium]|nr:hypothetical protein [Candidatus Saccharimonadales bacterium]
IAFYIAVMILSVVLITVIPTRSFQEASALGTKSGIQDEGSRVKPGMTKRNLFQFLIPLLFLLCSLGFFVGIILIYIQAFVLHAFCQYCLLSELIDFLLFDASWWLYNSQKGTV